MKRLTLALMLVAMCVTPLLNAGTALAAPKCSGQTFYGRVDCHGYFTGRVFNTDGWQNVLSNGVFPNSLNGYLTTMHNYLHGGVRDATGAAFTIDAMLGRSGPSFGGSIAAGIQYAKDHEDDWITLVTRYSRLGLIDWNYNWTTPSVYENSAYNPPDKDEDFHQKSKETIAIILFKLPPGTSKKKQPFRIERSCGNLVGDTNGLLYPDFDIQLDADPNGTPNTLTPGGTGSIHFDLTNTADFPSDPGTLEVQKPTAISATGYTQSNLLYNYTSSKGYRGNTVIPGATAPDWYWNVKAIDEVDGDKPNTTSGTLNFTVAANAVQGSTVTFVVKYYPGNLAGAVRTATVSFRIAVIRLPAVVADNGDVHAGGGLCDSGNMYGGTITGRSGAGSLGQYVVSATGAISNVGSNGQTSGKIGTPADNLKLGRNGAYLQICRPDLLAAALAYGGAQQTIGGADFDVTGKPAGVYFARVGMLTLHGTISNSITVVNTSGSVRISGALQLDGATHAVNALPALGVIASSDIDINAAVTRVDAYLFANGNIDTCLEASTACANTLVVNGFLMGKSMSLHRLGPANALNRPGGPALAEHVILDPRIYLNPPKLFDGSVDETLMQGQGERQPLF